MSKIWIQLILLASLNGILSCSQTDRPSDERPGSSGNAVAPEPAVAVQRPQSPLFRECASELGIQFQHAAGTNGRFLMPEIMGAGAALLDFDQDGDLDVYLVNGGPSASLSSSPEGANQLWRQNHDGRFENVTQTVGAGDEHFGMGVAVADVNNDGFPDLYVTNYGADQLYLNDQGLRFVNVTKEAGIANERWSVSAAFADINRDGWLDLYVANYVDYDPSRSCPTADGLPDYCNPQLFPGTTDLMLLNSGSIIERDGLRIPTFRDISVESGIGSAKGAGLGVGLIDANQDGWIDWYVANDMTANFLWINQRNGTFIDEAIIAGVAFDGIGNGQASMGVVVADIDGNQLEDVFLTHLTGETNTLYLQTQSSLFEVATHPSGLGRPSFAETGFGVAGFDLENDGDLDLAVVNGKVTLAASSEQRSESSPGVGAYAQRHQLFVQQSPGRFIMVDDPGFCREPYTSRGLAAGDIDQDGDVDLLVNNAGSNAELWFNDAQPKGNWIELELTLPEFGGRAAVGALATVISGEARWIRRLTSSGSYASAHAEQLCFGLGAAEQIDAVDVQWPDGTMEQFSASVHAIVVNQRVQLKQGAGKILERNPQ